MRLRAKGNQLAERGRQNAVYCLNKGGGMQGYRDLKVYQLAYQLAMEIYNETKPFPKDEKYSLTDQIRRSSRSVATHIAEAYRKRQYQKMFVSKLADADGETAETQVWLDSARDCAYLPPERRDEPFKSYEEVGKMLGAMMTHPEKFIPYNKKAGDL